MPKPLGNLVPFRGFGILIFSTQVAVKRISLVGYYGLIAGSAGSVGCARKWSITQKMSKII